MTDAEGRSGHVTAGFVALGAIAAGAAVAVPAERSVLLALAGTAFLGALVTRLVVRAPGHPAIVAEAIHAAHASTVDRLALELDCAGPAVYVPVRTGVRLYVPRAEGPIPSRAALADALVTADGARGLTVAPVGAALLARLAAPDGPESLEDRCQRLREAVLDRFELAGGLDCTPASGRVTVTVSDPSIEPLDRRDHPIVSTFAVGLAEHRERPVRVAIDERTITFTWDTPVDSNEGSS